MSSRCSFYIPFFPFKDSFRLSRKKTQQNKTRELSSILLTRVHLQQVMNMLASYMGWWYWSVTTMVLSACSWFAQVLPRHTTPCGAHDSAFLRRLHQSDALECFIHRALCVNVNMEVMLTYLTDVGLPPLLVRLLEYTKHCCIESILVPRTRQTGRR